MTLSICHKFYSWLSITLKKIPSIFIYVILCVLQSFGKLFIIISHVKITRSHRLKTILEYHGRCLK